MTDPTAPEGAPAPPAAEPNPWESWGQVFNDPTSVNPYEVGQHYQWVQDLRGDETHAPTLQRALRDWGYLQGEETIDDLQAALQNVRESRQDPFASMRNATGANQPDPYGNGGEIDENGMPVDPYALREVWTADMEAREKALEKRLEEREQQMQFNMNLRGQFERIAGAENLAPDDRAYLWDQVQFALQSGNVNPQRIDHIVEDVHKGIQQRFEAWMNARVSAGETTPPPPGGAPAPGPGGAGAVPTGKPPIRSLKDIARATIERMGDD